jgi:hypothetical protein
VRAAEQAWSLERYGPMSAPPLHPARPLNEDADGVFEELVDSGGVTAESAASAVAGVVMQRALRERGRTAAAVALAAAAAAATAAAKKLHDS